MPIIISIRHNDDNDIAYITIVGQAGQPFLMQRSSDLQDWSTARTGTMTGSAQEIQFPAAQTQYFYRFEKP